ncbi:MAG: 2-phospho-L-lactate guanylyltransferase [Actinomycetia bacterium]|nr:2-phospho-L-lactate guanylyltransferase [Actinomycetes bacterium]
MWHVVVALKGWGASKSRLALPETARRQIVRAMAVDTIAALTRCPEVQTISVLVRDHDLIDSPVLRGIDDVVVQPDTTPSLDVALSWFATTQVTVQMPLAVVVADLPALRAQSLSEVLLQANEHSFALVADRAGSGTTVLTALLATDLDPHFGTNSAAAHLAAGATLVVSPADVACDVDTLTDLAHARLLGLGSRTAALLANPAWDDWLV